MIEGIFYIESQGNNEGVVKSALEDMVKKMKAEKGVEVAKTTLGDVVKEGNNFSSNVEVEVSFETLRDYFRTSMRYVPYAIILDSPNKLKISSHEFLKILAEIAAITKRFLEKRGISPNIPDWASDVKDAKKDMGEGGRLNEDEIDALLDQGALRVKMVVQMEGKEDEAMRQLLGALGKEVFVHKMKASRLEDKTLVAVHAFMYEPKTLVELSIKLSPVYIEILEPDKLELSMLNIQDIGLELASAYFELAHLHLQSGSPS